MKSLILNYREPNFTTIFTIVLLLCATISFSQVVKTGNNSIDIDGENVRIKNGNKVITTNSDETTIRTTNTKIKSTNNPKKVSTRSQGNNGINLKTGNNSIRVDGNIHISNGNTKVECIDCNESKPCVLKNCTNYEDYDQYFYNCGSDEIAELPKNAIGLYRGDLAGFNVDTNKGICKIVRTGCKTYRLDFSDGIPSVYGVQFTRKNDFNEYTSVIIEGRYSSDIEIDMSFDDLKIEGDLLRMEFDGEKQ